MTMMATHPRNLLLLLPFWWWYSLSLPYVTSAWIASHRRHAVGTQHHHHQVPTKTLFMSTTPFEANYYNDNDNNDDDEEEDMPNPFSQDISPLQVLDSRNLKLVLGLNKYSHDTTLCAADAKTGEVLVVLHKERFGERHKHDTGNVASLVEKCLFQVLGLQGRDLKDIVETVVVNNHHGRVLPYEQDVPQLEWEANLQMNFNGDGVEEEENLLQSVSNHVEVSHHLAHAYSVAAQAPFDHGLVMVMDGMGETYRAMKRASKEGEETYYSDFDHDYQVIPSDLEQRIQSSPYDWREAESVYTFTKDNDSNMLDIECIFKRFQEEKTPPYLYNHGFHNMDSVGAVYSRASSHIFGDWNACGKVMGLAPWIQHKWTKDDSGDDLRDALQAVQPKAPILSGNLHTNDGLTIDRSILKGMPLIARNDADLFDPYTMVRRRRYDFDDNDYGREEAQEVQKEVTEINPDAQDDDEQGKVLPAKVALDAIGVASRVQDDLESIVLDFVDHFQTQTGECNLCLAGGVALNSVLNGKIASQFENTFIPPYPGDDGIAVGCCAFGLYGPPTQAAKRNSKSTETSHRTNLWQQPLSPYLGPEASEFQIRLALEAAAPWIEIETVRNPELRIERITKELQEKKIVALYQGRSEVGPRALGHRSILADPRVKTNVRFINQFVKKRESFRPFAPSVLAEHVSEWFEDSTPNMSPYMSMTAMVKEEKRKEIPAVTHVDGSSRLQTVTPESDEFYHRLLSIFHRQTGVPMLLNTSFNTIPNEPIVESPKDAIRSFLYAQGSISVLVLGDYIITRKAVDLEKLFSQSNPACPQRAGQVEFQSSFSLQKGLTQEEMVDTTTKVRMPDRFLHHDEKNNWFPLVDELEGEVLSISDGTNNINDIMAFFTTKPTDEEFTEEDLAQGEEYVQLIAARLARLFEETFLYW